MHKRIMYGVMLSGGIAGMAAAFLQLTEKIQLLKNTGQPLACDLSSVFSCSNVLNAWQSSVFGFPNSIMCLVFFTIFASFGLAGLSGAMLPRKLRLGIQGLALFVLGFALWFMAQSIYVIGSLCILCIFCFVGLLLVNGAWLRLNASDLPISAAARARLERGIAKGTDILAWFLLAAAVAFSMLFTFY